jgi:alpha-amylase
VTKFHQPAFYASSNIYAVNVRQYTEEGTFEAFSKHLPRLKDMGVDILWFMPIHPIGAIKRKGSLGSYYSIQDFKEVNPEFGNKVDFENLVKTAHGLGMKVILDWVANHAAWDNVWTKSNPDFFEQDESGNFKAPYDWDDVIQINHSNPAEQQAMIDAMKYWVTDFDIDGFRADLAHLTPLPFWINARTQITPLKKNLVWLAETEDIPYHQAFDISFTWKWMHITEEYCKGQADFKALPETLEYYKTYFPLHAMRMYFTSNHDENSWCGTEYEKYDIYARALAVFSCTWHAIPLIYSGQELPVTRRLKFFDKDTIEWTHEILLHDFYKTLLQLRKTNKAISSGIHSLPVLLETSSSLNLLAFYRKKDDHVVLVFLNMSKEFIQYDFATNELKGNYRNVFSGEPVVLHDTLSISLEAGEYLVIEK